MYIFDVIYKLADKVKPRLKKEYKRNNRKGFIDVALFCAKFLHSLKL
jgi:hypothetical protein